MKYNGLDYSAIAKGSAEVKTTIIEKTIERSGVGCTQIMLALDCSSSAWQTYIEPGKTRLDVQINAAKKLIEKLLEDSEKNVYIGLVCFGGDNSAIRIISLTNNKTRLIEALDAIQQTKGEKGKVNLYDFVAGTNIINAINKCDESFVEVEGIQNKCIILLSDGAPTSDGSTTKIYSDDSDEVLKRALTQIANNTRERLKESARNGEKIYSFIVESDAPEEQEIVDKLFQLGDDTTREGIRWGYYLTQDQEEEITNTIQNEIYNSIKEEVSESENSTDDIDILEFYGEDDIERRKEVTNNFSSFNYEKISKINSSNINDIKDFLGNSYITVTINNSYTIESRPRGKY